MSIKRKIFIAVTLVVVAGALTACAMFRPEPTQKYELQFECSCPAAGDPAVTKKTNIPEILSV